MRRKYVKPEVLTLSLFSPMVVLAASPKLPVQPGGGGGGEITVEPPKDDGDEELWLE